MAEIKYSRPECKFFFDGKKVVTNGKKKKKMSGSRLGAILGLNPFGTSQFQIACDLLGIAKKELTSHAVNAGNVLEEPLIRFMNENAPEIGIFMPAKDVFPGHDGEHDKRVSDWEDEYFSGNIDCMLYGSDGNRYIVDVKTTSNIGAWENGAPEYYALQVALYNYFLTKQDKAYFIVCVLTPEEQAHPEKVKFELMHTDGENVVGNVMLVETQIDQAIFEMRLNRCIEWYKEYIENYTTPEYEDPIDSKLVQHLQTIGLDVNEIIDYADQLESIETELKIKEAELDGIKSDRDLLREKIKDFMVNNDLVKLPTSSGRYEATITKQTRRSVSESLLKKAGIDPEPYIVVKNVNSFSLKLVKEKENENEQNIGE